MKIRFFSLIFELHDFFQQRFIQSDRIQHASPLCLLGCFPSFYYIICVFDTNDPFRFFKKVHAVSITSFIKEPKNIKSKVTPTIFRKKTLFIAKLKICNNAKRTPNGVLFALCCPANLDATERKSIKLRGTID